MSPPYYSPQPTPMQDPELICEDAVDPKTKKHVLHCSLHIGRQSGKHLSEPLDLIMKRNYMKGRSRLHKLLDGIGFLVLGGLIAALVILLIPKNTPDFIIVDAAIAPSEVITGGSSTLTFRYENQSDEDLRNVRVIFGLPEHFRLQELMSEDAELVSERTIALGDIPPTGYGTIHVKGTMFGDVGGSQVFDTMFSYDYGEDLHDEKTLSHTFSPTASTLDLELMLPEFIVAHQEVSGTISYHNTGDVDFPDVTIEPQWPSNFRLISSSPELTDGSFLLTPLAARETGIIEFTGQLGNEDDRNFSFIPSFRFGDIRYHQDILTDLVEILPPPVSVSHTVDVTAIEPGGSAEITVRWVNESDYTIRDVSLRLDADTTIFGTGSTGGAYQDGYFILDEVLTEIQPGDEGSATISLPVRSTFPPIETTITQPSASFTFKPDGEDISSNTVGPEVTSLVATPIVLQSFGQYYTSAGDQIGRGPIPPYVGETTKIWVFWNVSGTTHALTGVDISAALGPGVSLTGKQSVSYGSAISESGGRVRWHADEINATADSASRIIGIAFEVQLTPDESQIGQTPLLTGAPVLTGRDTVTDTYRSQSGASVTTYLSSDAKARSYGGIVEE
jgi:hypothetical protein